MRSSYLEVFCKEAVLKNLAKFTGKHLRQSLFLNKSCRERERELQKRLWHWCFPVNFEKFYEHVFYRITPVVPIPQTPMNAWKFCKIQSLFLMDLQKGDYGTDVFLWILQNFKNTFFYKTPLVALATSNIFDNWN